MHRPRLLLIVFGLLSSLAVLSLLEARLTMRMMIPELKAMARQVEQLQLTDLALFTEARYTRHLTQADRHSPFQDHPLAFEHFPSGSLVSPPAALRMSE